MRILVLGSAAGGGYPQWNCRCPVCQLAWSGDFRVKARTQSSLAVSLSGDRWLLLNASPDLRSQILATPALQPKHGLRHSPIDAVYITNGDVDHITGLISLREQQAFTVYATSAILSLLGPGSVFGVMNPQVVSRVPVALGESVEPLPGLTVTSFAVPGKVPLFLEGDVVETGAIGENTIGLEISGGGKRFFYIPGCARLTPELLSRVKGAPLIFFDGTLFTDDEMVAAGLSQKTGQRMGHMSMSGPDGSIVAFSKSEIARKVYVHINNSNPALIDGSPQRLAVESAGWEVAEDGMEIVL
jgi:pyrroloquinoline quinone biosynthesis protein B